MFSLAIGKRNKRAFCENGTHNSKMEAFVLFLATMVAEGVPGGRSSLVGIVGSLRSNRD